MICDKHELDVRMGKCPLCVKETEDQLDFEIRQRELKQLSPVLS